MGEVSESTRIDMDGLALVGLLAAGAAHEIRNPLTTLKGFVRLLKQGASPQYLDIMESELSRIEAIVGDLLVLSRPRALQVGTMSAARLIGETISLFEAQAKAQAVEFREVATERDVWLEGEASRIKQVLVNVIKNALEAMPHGGTIELSAGASREETMLAVRDEGRGMTKDQLKRAGEPFFTTKEQGTGLGLMVCRRIMEQHGGRLAIESRPGAGTAVYLFFPRKGN